MTITDAVAVMDPPMPRRELARRLADVEPTGKQYGSRGRRPSMYPLAAIMQAHAEWCRQNVGHLPIVDQACQNADGQRCAR